MAAAAALAEVHQCLQWIGFGDINHHNAIIQEGGLTSCQISSILPRPTSEIWQKAFPSVPLQPITSSLACITSCG